MIREHDIALVPVSGALCTRTAPALKHTLNTLIDKGCRRIVLNMAEVPYVDSNGMAVIIYALRRMRMNNGLLSLVNVTPNVMRSLKIARLVDFVTISALGDRREVVALDPSVQPLWRKTLPIDARDLCSARTRVRELASRMAFSRDAVFDLTLAVGEALGNAADHTCGSGILATVSAYPDRMIVEVTDCGEGFDKDQAARPDCEACEERGRGIKLMNLLVDSVSIQNRPSGTGTVVRLEKLV